ncbi:hypothetical protein GQ457_08G037450 [Hibiscus cannabinus]
MKYFIKAQDFEIWKIIEDGLLEVPKKKKKRSAHDMKTKLNAKAMHTLVRSINEGVSKQVSICKTAKDICEKLEKLYGNKKEEKKHGVSSCDNLFSSSKEDGVLALDEPKMHSMNYFWNLRP